MLTDSASCATDGALPVTFAPPLEPGALRAIERQLHLRFNKWDTQVGDVSVLCEHPLVMRGSEWDRICAAAEALAAETKQMEARTLDSSRDLSEIGVPRKLREILVIPSFYRKVVKVPGPGTIESYGVIGGDI